MHHVDTTTDVLKEMMKEMQTDVTEIAKQLGRNNKSNNVKPNSNTSDAMAQKEAREWREKMDTQMIEMMNAIADLRKSQEMIARVIKRRQSSFSSQGDPSDLLKVESLSTLKKKKKKRQTENLERSTSEPTGDEDATKRRGSSGKSKKSKE